MTCSASVVLLSSAALAETRVAFLVGNSTYEHAAPLANPVKDVDLIGKTLADLGFEVSLHDDLTRDGIGRELAGFLKQHADADVVLFYYAGHGMQFEGKNYLVGVDARLETEFDVDAEALDLDRVVSMLERASKASLVFVDACRNNPLADQFYRANFSETRALTTRGLAPVETSHNGSMLTFSASPGQLAYDGDEYSPFALALARNLPAENIEVLSLMKRVIRDVKDETGAKQIPLVTNDLTQEIYLRPRTDEPSAEFLLAEEKAVFDAALSVGGLRAIDLYFRRYPDGFLRDMAMAEREKLEVAQLAEDSGIASDAIDLTQPIPIPAATAKASEEGLGITRDIAMLVQQALNGRGFDAGTVDGLIGSGTRKAITAFQASETLPETGVITRATASALGIDLDTIANPHIAYRSVRNAKSYDPEALALIEDDERLIKAAEYLKTYEYAYGYFEDRLYIAVLSWGIHAFDAAEHLAEGAGGHLATLTSREENEFVVNLASGDFRFWRVDFDRKGTIGPGFGLVQAKGSREPAGGWGWVTDEKLGYANWARGYPAEERTNSHVAQFYKNENHVVDHGTPVATWGDWPEYNIALIVEIE